MSRFTGVALVAFAIASSARIAAAATGCKAEIVPEVAAPEVKRLQNLLEAAKFDGEMPIAFYLADINNDGRSEIVGTGFGGSMGVLSLTIFVERGGKAEELPGDVPQPKEIKDGEGLWYQFQGFRGHLLLKLCDRTIVSFAGDEDGAFDGFVWKDGKTTRACDPDWTSYELSVFKGDYDAQRFEKAKGVLRGYLRTCGPRLKPEARLSLLSNLAVTSLHLGDHADCVRAVKQARKIPGFETSKSKAALLFNEAACTNPPVDAKKADYRWLVDPKLRPADNTAYGRAYDALLAATVPALDFETAQLDMRVKSWLGAGLRVPRGAIKARSQIELRRMIHDRQVLSGSEGREDGRSVLANRYVTIWGCMPHDCEDRSMIWVDVQTGASAFATNDFRGCFAVGSRTLAAKDLPAAFKDALADWKQNKQPLAHDCTVFVDGTKFVTSVGPLP